MSISGKQLSLIHIGKARLALTDDVYRAILHRVAGVKSARELDTLGVNAVMEAFYRLGFESTAPHKPFGSDRPGMATNRQCRLIRALWAEWTGGQGTDASLGQWLDRSFAVSALRFVTAEHAAKAITALKVMKGRRRPESASA